MKIATTVKYLVGNNNWLKTMKSLFKFLSQIDFV